MDREQKLLDECEAILKRYPNGAMLYKNTRNYLNENKFSLFKDDLPGFISKIKGLHSNERNLYFVRNPNYISQKVGKHRRTYARRSTSGEQKKPISIWTPRENIPPELIENKDKELKRIWAIIGVLQDHWLPLVQKYQADKNYIVEFRDGNVDLGKQTNEFRKDNGEKKSTKKTDERILKKIFNNIEILKSDFNSSRIASIISESNTTVWRKLNNDDFLGRLINHLDNYQKEKGFDTDINSVSEELTAKFRKSKKNKQLKREKAFSDFKNIPSHLK